MSKALRVSYIIFGKEVRASCIFQIFDQKEKDLFINSASQLNKIYARFL
jgi:hypothetical protein